MGKHSIEVHQESSTAQKIDVPLLEPHEELQLEPGATGLPYESGGTLYSNGLRVQAELQGILPSENSTPKIEVPADRQEIADDLKSEALRLAVGADDLSRHDVPKQDDLGYMPHNYQSGKDLPKRQ